MKVSELEKLYLETTEHGIFTPNYSYDSIILNEETKEYEYVGLVIRKTAQEVYDGWLESKNASLITTKSKIEILQEQLEECRLEQVRLHEMIIALEGRMGGNE